MKFTSFNLEESPCEDYVMVHEDQVKTPKICGAMSEPLYKAHGNRTFYANNQLKIDFHSDVSVVAPGFEAVFALGE